MKNTNRQTAGIIEDPLSGGDHEGVQRPIPTRPNTYGDSFPEKTTSQMIDGFRQLREQGNPQPTYNKKPEQETQEISQTLSRNKVADATYQLIVSGMTPDKLIGSYTEPVTSEDEIVCSALNTLPELLGDLTNYKTRLVAKAPVPVTHKDVLTEDNSRNVLIGVNFENGNQYTNLKDKSLVPQFLNFDESDHILESMVIAPKNSDSPTISIERVGTGRYNINASANRSQIAESMSQKLYGALKGDVEAGNVKLNVYGPGDVHYRNNALIEG